MLTTFFIVITILNTVTLILIIRNIPKVMDLFFSTTGIPLNSKIPIKNDDIKLSSERNILLCLDIDCNKCEEIINYLFLNKHKLNNICLIFLSNYEVTEKYFKGKGYNLDLYQYTYSTAEELFLKVKPFSYIVSKHGLILDKYPISKPNQLLQF